MSADYVQTFRQQVEKIKTLQKLILKEKKQLSDSLDEEKKKLASNNEIIKNLINEIDKLDEENFVITTQIKLEELKSKTCSDETLKSFESLLNEINSEIEFYQEKNEFLKDDTNIEISFMRQNSIIKIKFLQNGQEIIFNLRDPNNVVCSYDECTNELVDGAQKQIMNNLIKEFNSTCKQNKNTAELVIMLRDLFNE